jgi:hypothetical protein
MNPCTVCTTPAGCVARRKCGYLESQRERTLPSNFYHFLLEKLAEFNVKHRAPATFIRMNPKFYYGLLRDAPRSECRCEVLGGHVYPDDELVRWNHGWFFLGIPFVQDKTVASVVLVLEETPGEASD